MGLEDIVRIFTFLLGSALQISILGLMAKRKSQRGREITLALFAFSCLGWTFGVFISIFCGYLYKGANLLEQIFGGVAVFSLAFVFPLFVNIVLSFASKKYLRIPSTVQCVVYLAIYSPCILHSNTIWVNIVRDAQNSIFFAVENFIEKFVFWIFANLFVVWGTVSVIYKKSGNEEDERFLKIVWWMSVCTMLLYLLAFPLNGRHLPGIGPYLSLLPQMLTFFLPPLIAYYIYFYNYMEYIFKRAVIYCVLGICVIVLYLFSIRPLGESLEKQFQINFKIIEGILVMALVFFFDPFRRALQEMFNRAFFREKQYYRKVFSDISQSINKASYMDLENLLDDVAHTISCSMKIREVSFIFFSQDQDRLTIRESTLAISANDIQSLVEYIVNKKLALLNIYDLSEKDAEIVRELKKIKAFTVLPIWNENKLIGIFSIGKRKIRHQLRAEEEEMLNMLINQMVIALENTRLAREKFTLERKMYENEKLSSLGRLSASIAHEVKNPLSSIKTIAQVMKEEFPPNDPNQEGLSLIIGEIDRLSRVVKQLLLFARPHSGLLTKVDISEVLHDVLLLLKHEADRNHVVIEKKIDEGEIALLSDRDALSEIFFNLVHNAIQALPDGGKVLVTQTTEYDSKGIPTCIKVSVADNGPGIPSIDREKIFEPFYTTKQTGTGLGLTIVKHRLDKLKGTISVREHHGGALLEVCFPIDHADKVEIPDRIDATTQG